MPKLGESMTKGRIVKWLKKQGDAVEEGEPLFEVETEKAVFEVTSPIDGTIHKIVAFEGDDVPVKRAIAFIEESR
jgi:pyruvate dehydrogenase E2 component (dihydrolipoamide acetyltransferase)